MHNTKEQRCVLLLTALFLPARTGRENVRLSTAAAAAVAASIFSSHTQTLTTLTTLITPPTPTKVALFVQEANYTFFSLSLLASNHRFLCAEKKMEKKQ